MKTKKIKNTETESLLDELVEIQKDSIEIPQTSHYVDNKKFLAALIDYKASIDAAKEKNEEAPQVPRYIGECFIKIATHLSYKSNFINYTFKDDMISDAYMKCLKAVKSFNPEKANAFAYFTTVIHNSFLTSISRSKYQIEMKEKIKDRLYDELAQRYGNLIDVRSLVDDEMEQ